MSSSSIQNPKEHHCLGTRLMVLANHASLRQKDKKSSTQLASEGLLAVYLYQRKESVASQALFLEVGTSSSVYKHEIDSNRVRLATMHHEQDVELHSILLATTKSTFPNYSVEVEHNEDGNLNLNILHKLDTGLQRSVYKGVLVRSDDRSSVLKFCHTLGKSVNMAIRKVKTLEGEKKEEEEKLEHWRGTAERLSRDVWQKEKDRLVHNFLKLWNERQRRAKKQLEELKEKLAYAERALECKTSGKKRARQLELDEQVRDGAEDDLEGSSEPILDGAVEALASGIRVKRNNNPAPILKAEDTISGAKLVKEEQAYESKMRRKKKKLTPKTHESIDTDGSDDNVLSTNDNHGHENIETKEESTLAAAPSKKQFTFHKKPSDSEKSFSDLKSAVPSVQSQPNESTTKAVGTLKSQKKKPIFTLSSSEEE